MKKILLLLCLLLFGVHPSLASVNVIVKSLTDFPEYSETKSLRAVVIQDTEVKEGIVLQKDAILDNKLVEIIPPKRLKRNGYIIVEPVVYIYGGLVLPVKSENLRARVKYYKKRDYKKMAVNAGLSVGSHFVKGAKYAVNFSQGVISPNEGESRIKSGFENVYENSALSYISKGKPINIAEGDELVFEFFYSDTPKWKFWKR